MRGQAAKTLYSTSGLCGTAAQCILLGLSSADDSGAEDSSGCQVLTLTLNCTGSHPDDFACLEYGYQNDL